MLDLKKYLRRASADPGFRARLLKNANQAIKDEFGEDLPYKLKCKEKLTFEVETMDGVAESDLEGVAGGDNEEKVQDFAPAPLINHLSTGNVCLKPAPPVMNDSDLEGVAGGELTTNWNSAWDTNPRTANEYRRSYGFNSPQGAENEATPIPSLNLTKQSGGLIVNTGDGGSKIVPPNLSISRRHGWWRY